MRIISGKFRGRSLYTPHDLHTRPTSDRVRESIFNVLENGLSIKWTGLHILDLYAGTGALGIEALSRGASFCLFIDQHSHAIDIVKRNASLFPHTTIWQEDAVHLKVNPYSPFDVIFLDPPYKKNLVPSTLQNLLSSNYLKNECCIIIEISNKEEVNLMNSFEVLKEKTYGNTKIIFVQYKKNF